MLNKKLLLLIFITMVSGASMVIAGGGNKQSLILSDLLKQAIENNPGINASYNEAQRLSHRVPQAGSLPDLNLHLGILNMPVDNFSMDQDPMSQKMIGISQNFPFFGIQSLREDIAEKQFELSNLDYTYAKLELIRKIKLAYYRLDLVYNSIRIVEQNEQLMTEVVGIASTKYQVGQGIQQDVLRSQIELLKLTQRKLEFEEKRENIISQINGYINQPVESDLGIPVVSDPKPSFLLMDSLRHKALVNNPILRKSGLEIEKQHKEKSLASKEYWPDFKIAANYGQRVNRSDFISGILSVDIPLYAGSNQSEKVQEKTMAIKAAEMQYNDRENQLMSFVNEYYNKVNKNIKLMSLYKNEMLPNAEQIFTTSISAYQNNKIDFLTLLDNQSVWYDQELAYRQIVMEYYTSLAYLEFFCGTDLKNSANQN